MDVERGGFTQPTGPRLRGRPDLHRHCDVYSIWVPGHIGGESETILGKWFKRSGRRSEVILATKVGIDMGGGKKGLGAKYIRQAVEDSLRRLQTDYIDLYHSHRDDLATPIEETLGAFDELVKAGKVRYIGASNYSGARLAESMETSSRNGLAAYISLEPHYNMVERAEFESDLLPVVEKYSLGVIPYFSLAAGFLTGKYRQGERYHRQCSRACGAEVFERARIRRRGRTRRSRKGARRNSGACGSGLADAKTGSHGPHCQRNERSPVARPHCGDRAESRSRGGPATG